MAIVLYGYGNVGRISGNYAKDTLHKTFLMHRQILRLAIPNILSNLSVPLLGIIDTALMGRMDDPVYLGAIALGSVVFSFIYWGFGFLRMGTTGLTAQAYGKSQSDDILALLMRGLCIAVGGSVILIIMQGAIESISFQLMAGEEDVETHAKSYFRIRIYAAPATLGLYVFHGWFLGLQNAKYPMWLTIFVNICNIIFNLVFIVGWGMKSDGVAWGTVIAQYFGLSLAFILFFYRYKSYLSYWDFRRLLDPTGIREFFHVNADIFIRTICLIFTFGYFTSTAASLGSDILAANQVLLQFFYLMSFGVDGFAFAAESLVGKFKGAAQSDQLKQVIQGLLIWGLGLGLLFSIIYLIAGPFVLFLFTDQALILETAREYVYWLALIPLLGAAAFMWDGVYIGATATKAMRNTMLLATGLCFFPIAYWGVDIWGNHALWLAMAVFMAARSVLLTVLAKKEILPAGIF